MHIDIKHIGVIRGYGKQYQFTAIDDATRKVFAKRYNRKDVKSAVEFLENVYKWSGGKIERVMVDNGLEFTHHSSSGRDDHKFLRKAGELEVVVKFTKKRRPQTNGKVERVHRTFDEEFYFRHFFVTPDELEKALEEYVWWYNNKRYHLGIKGLTPEEKYAKLIVEGKGVMVMKEVA